MDAALRVCVTDVFRAQGQGVSVAGKLETGVLGPGDRLLVLPGGETATVKGRRCLTRRSSQLDNCLTRCSLLSVYLEL